MTLLVAGFVGLAVLGDGQANAAPAPPCWQSPIPNCPPLAPVMSPMTQSDGTFRIGYVDASNDETGFEIQHRRQSQTTWQTIAVRPATAGTGTASTVSVHEPLQSAAETNGHCFRVLAVNSHGFSASPGQCRTATVDPPAAPSHLVFSSVTPTSLHVSWSENATNETDNLLRWSDPAGVFQTIHVGAHTGTGSIGTAVSTLAENATYCFTAIAVRTIGTQSGTAASPQSCVTTPARADIVSVEAWTDPTAFPDEWEPFYPQFRVCNEGGVATGDFTYRLTEYGTTPDGSQVVADASYDFTDSLAAGACMVTGLPYPVGAPAGDYSFDLYLDIYNQVAERSETNNYGHDGVIVGL